MKKSNLNKLSIFIVSFVFILIGIAKFSSAKVLATANNIEIELESFKIISKGHSDPQMLLDQVINFVLLADEAQKQNYKIDPIFEEKLKLLKDQQLVQYFQRKKIEEKATLTDKEIEDSIPPYGRKKVNFEHIVVKTMAEAQDIISSLERGMDFNELAKKKSIAADKTRGGRIGFVTMDTGYFEGEISAEDEKSLFKLNDGQWSNPIKTRKGYAIYKALGHEELTPQDMENKKRYIRFKKGNKKLTEAQEELIKSLRENAKITRIEKNIKILEKADKIEQKHLELTLAKVDDHMIKLKDLFMGQSSFNQLNSPLLKQPSFLNKRIEDVTNLYLFLREAKRLGYDKQKSYQNLIDINKYTMLGQDYAMIKVLDSLSITDEELKEFYNENKNMFLNTPERIRIQTILLQDKNEAREILQKLKAGADFANLAIKHSKDPSVRYTKGDAGFIPVSQLQSQGPEFLTAIKSLKIGQISNVIDTKAGYYIVKVIDQKDEGSSEFEDVKWGVEKYVKLKKLEEYINNLRSKSTIKIDEKAIAALEASAPKAPKFQPPQGGEGNDRVPQGYNPPPPPRN